MLILNKPAVSAGQQGCVLKFDRVCRHEIHMAGARLSRVLPRSGLIDYYV